MECKKWSCNKNDFFFAILFAFFRVFRLYFGGSCMVLLCVTSL